MPPPSHQILAFVTVFIFVVFVCFYGVTENINGYPAIRGQEELSTSPLNDNITERTPDLSKYQELLTLSRKEFPIDEPGRRVVVVGDIHGMIKPLKKLLRKVNYDSSHDVLIHTGDILAKGGRKSSFKVLDFLLEHRAHGVRGNHDQKVVEWRNWIDYIDTLRGGSQWLEHLERRWKASELEEDDLEDWLEDEEEQASNATEKRLLKLIPKGWVMFSDHYYIAKGLTLKQFNYLLRLPLRIYVPSAHVFIVHAGVLPVNPKHSIDDKKRQPLARVPTMPRMPGPPIFSSLDVVQKLRNLQELAVLTEIPQNTDPWVTLNMRGISHGEVERDTSVGQPWTDVWKECMKSCVGYGKKRQSADFHEDNNNAQWDTAELDTEKKYELPCYPLTTIYGHAASRGLDLKRWSFGLDTGCVYGRKLTAMIIEGQDFNAQSYDPDSLLAEDKEYAGDEDADDDDEDAEDDDEEIEGNKSRPFADRSEAKFYSVKC